ncbi:WXG100 family type VII secretion target [Saccharothrix carnea]|uniref:WXG100 family type VII secretion target n=1 Tax=Saccharothrix carnea TaxID=1280637 RepID=UPI0015E6D0CE|nr:hypothetical protein [Saccharothrix carnea]
MTTLPRPESAVTPPAAVAAPPGADTPSPDAGQIAALLAELRSVSAAVDNKEWLSGGLAGDPDAPLGAMSSTERPLSALDSAGVGFLTPMISFLEEPLGRLRGDPDSVSSGAGEFDSAGRDATSLAEEYRSTAAAETSEWSGQSASDYLKTGTELADGILSIGETALTSSKAMIAAGEVVAKVVTAVTQLIAEAVAKITPIITQALAAAPATFGQSLAVAIPQCVQIAVEYGGKIAGKLAELLASGENLIKLVEAALGVLKVVKEAVSFIGEQAQAGASSGDKPVGVDKSDMSDTSDKIDSEGLA